MQIRAGIREIAAVSEIVYGINTIPKKNPILHRPREKLKFF